MRPFVAEFVLKKVGKETKVQKDYLRPTSMQYLGEKGCSEELDQRRYTWDAPQFVPLSIGSCVSYNEFETKDGMFEDGQWREMTFFEIRKHLTDQAGSKPKSKAPVAAAPVESSGEDAGLPTDPFEQGTAL